MKICCRCGQMSRKVSRLLTLRTSANTVATVKKKELTRNSVWSKICCYLIFDVWLTGLRDWYLRNTIGSTHQNQANGKVNTAVNTKVTGGVKGQAGGGGALQSRRRTHGVIQQSTYQTETSHHSVPPHHKQTLPHSATFHGHPLHGR